MAVKAVPAEGYVMGLMGDKEFITSEDLPLNNDFDYVMSILIAAEYDHKKSRYRLDFLDGSVSKNGYTIPLLKFTKKS